MPPVKKTTLATVANTDVPLPETPLVGVYQKLEWVQAHVMSVPKTGNANFGAYFQEHGIMAILRPWQAALHFAILIDVQDARDDGNLRTARVILTMVDTELAPDHPSFSVSASYPMEATDKQGWGYAKLLTYGKKFALQKFFSVPTEDLPEQESSPVEVERAAPTSKVSTKAVKLEAVRADIAAAMATDDGFVQRFGAYLQTQHGVENLDQLTSDAQVTQIRHWIAAESAPKAA